MTLQAYRGDECRGELSDPGLVLFFAGSDLEGSQSVVILTPGLAGLSGWFPIPGRYG